MSASSQLIFTSSSQKAYDKWGYIKGNKADEDMAMTGVEDPNNYRNNLRNTIRIPPLSEIAVVNVEFNRAASFEASDENMFYWYYGPDMSRDNRSSNTSGYLPYPIYFYNEGYNEQELKNLDSAGLMRIFAQTLRYGITHPDFFNAGAVVLNTTGDKFQLTLETAAPVSVPLIDNTTNVASWMGVNRQNDAVKIVGGVEHADWDAEWGIVVAGGETTFKKNSNTDPGGGNYPVNYWDDSCRGICRLAPLSSNNGVWTGSFSGAPGGFSIGLTRPQTRDSYENNFSEDVLGYPDYPLAEFPDKYWKFCDYEVCFWQNPNGAGKKELRVYQVVYEGEGNDLRATTRELDYTDPAKTDGRPAVGINEDDMFGAGKKFNHYRWTLQGNAIQFEIGDKPDFSGTNQLIFSSITVSAGAPESCLPMPVHQMTESLYPLFDIKVKGEELVSTDFKANPNCNTNMTRYTDAGNITFSYDYPMDREDFMNTEAILGDDYGDNDGDTDYFPGTSFFGSVYSGAPEDQGGDNNDDNNLFWKVGIEGTMTLDILNYAKNQYKPKVGGVFTGLKPDYFRLDKSSETGSAVNGLISQATDDGVKYTDFSERGEYKTHPDEPPNTQLLLGMESKNLIQSIDGSTMNRALTVDVDNRARWVVVGLDELGEEPEPILVEVPSLNHQSYNMCRQCPSKFIYVCPRHDNNGDFFGKMFYEPGEKTYVALNNPAELNITDLEVRFTDKNGMTTVELQGNSAVTFHIRKEQR